MNLDLILTRIRLAKIYNTNLRLEISFQRENNQYFRQNYPIMVISLEIKKKKTG